MKSRSKHAFAIIKQKLIFVLFIKLTLLCIRKSKVQTSLRWSAPLLSAINVPEKYDIVTCILQTLLYLVTVAEQAG